MNDITQPLVLWWGSHRAGSGRGCAMNVISWENGDKTITDYPECSDRMLARIVQGVNDSMAQNDGSLTAEDSLKVLDLGHRTVGTAYHNLSDEGLKVVYVRLAVYAARKVAHLNPDPRVEAALAAAEAWADTPSDAAADAVDAAADADFRYELASQLIDLFIEMTNTKPVDLPVDTNDAIACMMATN